MRKTTLLTTLALVAAGATAVHAQMADQLFVGGSLVTKGPAHITAPGRVDRIGDPCGVPKCSIAAGVRFPRGDIENFSARVVPRTGTTGGKVIVRLMINGVAKKTCKLTLTKKTCALGGTVPISAGTPVAIRVISTMNLLAFYDWSFVFKP